MHETMTHDEAIELLPWLANDSLDPEERDVVRAHASSCVICRRELAELEALQQAIDSAAAQTEAPHADMRGINARIDAQLARESRPREFVSALRELVGSPWRIAFAMQTVALVVIAVLWLRPDTPDPVFRTLTTPDALPAGHYVRVVFDPGVDEPAVAALLGANDLSVIAGPSERGVITLRFADGTDGEQRAAIIQAMGEDSRVLFAQPVTGGD